MVKIVKLGSETNLNSILNNLEKLFQDLKKTRAGINSQIVRFRRKTEIEKLKSISKNIENQMNKISGIIRLIRNNEPNAKKWRP